MKDLKKYIKGNSEKMTCKQTSINIEIDQYDFVVENNLNLSRMVRDMLEELMAVKPKARSKSA